MDNSTKNMTSQINQAMISVNALLENEEFKNTYLHSGLLTGFLIHLITAKNRVVSDNK